MWLPHKKKRTKITGLQILTLANSDIYFLAFNLISEFYINKKKLLSKS